MHEKISDTYVATNNQISTERTNSIEHPKSVSADSESSQVLSLPCLQHSIQTVPSFAGQESEIRHFELSEEVHQLSSSFSLIDSSTAAQP